MEKFYHPTRVKQFGNVRTFFGLNGNNTAGDATVFS